MLEKWMTTTQKPLTILGFVFLVAFSLPIMFANLGSNAVHLCELAELIVWLAFLIDYVICVCLAPKKLEFIRGHLFGLAAVALPTLQPLRVLRALVLVLYVVKGKQANQRKSLIATTAIVAGTTWFFAALFVTAAERDASGTTIKTFGDGLWWAITTMATVGYGDTHPVTTGGRIVGATLMISSIALIGTMTATIASYFTEIFGSNSPAPKSQSTELDALTQEVRELREQISKLTHPDA